ncbi:hypothetical protein AK830_g668 [Neonectria ditissima]|uniref:Uncharacterized protein n=1 Tax=Neonectria ditissima TaxID=78410 RepID=A0A0P7BWG2_9HYPO|nr:hypothetical protein AK830_g668 [Neonectria ditissima]
MCLFPPTFLLPTVGHDAMGHTVEETMNPGTPHEATRRQDYALCADGKGYDVTSTDAQGSKVRMTTDAMERQVFLVKQDDSDGGKLRTVREYTYNTPDRRH